MVTIRTATPNDYSAVRDLTYASYVAAGHVDTADPYVAELTDISSRAKQLYVAEIDGQVAGSVTIAPPDSSLIEVAEPGELEFRMLAVHPGFQGRGIGRALVQYVLDYARTNQLTSVAITTMASMTTAQAMYTAMGFQRAPHRDWTLYTAGIVDYQEGLETFLVYVHALNLTTPSKGDPWLTR